MPKRKDPQERSAASSPETEQSRADQSDDVVDETSPPADNGSDAASADLTDEELAELEELQRASDEAFQRAVDAADQFVDRAVEAYDIGRAFVRDNPGGSIAGAFAIGLALGILSSRG